MCGVAPSGLWVVCASGRPPSTSLDRDTVVSIGAAWREHVRGMSANAVAQSSRGCFSERVAGPSVAADSFDDADSGSKRRGDMPPTFRGAFPAFLRRHVRGKLVS